jgi:phosphohistidine swiveling domain-containing protein
MSEPVGPATVAPSVREFPVTWATPEDARLTWRWDQKHMPGPISPLGMDLCRRTFDPGMTQGMQSVGQPVSVRSLRINTFLYQAWDYDFPALPAAVDAIQRATFEQAVAMPERWQREFLPQVEAASAHLLAAPYPRLTDAELRGLIGWAIDTSAHMWEIHGALMFGWHVIDFFQSLCARLLGLSGVEALEMLQGEHNLSVEAASTLWRLAHGAAKPVQATIAGLPAAEAYARLRDDEAARAFVAALHDYVATYGWRKDNFDIADRSWAEEPWRALDSVRLMLQTELDPAEAQRRQARRAEARRAECLVRLAGDRSAWEQFLTVYDLVKHGPRLQEDHNLHLDQKFLTLARLPFLEAGRRMAAAGVLEQADDVIYLEVAEIRPFLQGDPTPRVAAVRERRAEMDRWRGYTPPEELGSGSPAGAADRRPDVGSDGRALRPLGPGGALQGLPAAPGTVTGTARVARLLSEAERVQAGDILVCEMTTPAWTPLFPALGGIVADTGGALSHCAVMAREYGLPCIVGTKGGTRIIPDGARITIDGGRGTVVVESLPS